MDDALCAALRKAYRQCISSPKEGTPTSGSSLIMEPPVVPVATADSLTTTKPIVTFAFDTLVGIATNNCASGQFVEVKLI